MNRILISAAAVLAASLSTFTAVAPGYAATVSPASIAVSYADLDLSRATDRETLEDRLEGAARQVCRAENGYSPLTRQIERDCRDEALAAATAQLPFPDSATD